MLPDGTIAMSGLQVLRDSAREKTVAEWIEVCGLREADVLAIARELTSHGKAAAVDIHRGVAQHTNGFYNVLGWMTVNMLLGNFDAKGGMSKATTYDTKGKGKGGLFDLTAHPGVPTPFGVSVIRHGVAYEKTTTFDGYPAKRNWYPLSSDVYESAIQPENGILVNPIDAARLGIAAGQLVKIVSATNPSGEWPLGNGRTKPMVGSVVLTHTIRPGVVSFALGFGHWATGASDITVDGVTIKAEKRRQNGVHGNAAMWTDPVVKNTCMFDPVGGSVSFYDTWVGLVAV